MAGMLEKLNRDEGVLLMYLADELAPDDKAQVERRLGSEPGLRAELDRLSELQSFVMGKLERLDDAMPAPVADEAAARRVVREMRRFQLELAVRPGPAEKAKASAAHPWWYGAGAVAAALIIVITLYGSGVIDVPVNNSLGPLTTADQGEEVDPSGVEGDGSVLAVDAGELTRSFESEPTQLDEARMHLVELELLAEGPTGY